MLDRTNKINSLAILIPNIDVEPFAGIAKALVKGFSSAGIKDLYIVDLRANQTNRSDNLPVGAHVIGLNTNRASRSVRACKKFIEQYKPDILITMPTTINVPSIVGWLGTKKVSGNTKLVISEHAIMSYEAFVEYKHIPKLRILPFLARFFYPYASGMVANSFSVQKDIYTLGIKMKGRSTVIPNPIDLNYVRLLSKETVDHNWLVDKKKPVILGVGRLAKIKNWPLLLEAFSLLKTEVDSRLVIIGEGSEKEHLERQIKKLNLERDVDLPGYQLNPWKWMARSDVLALTSNVESCGLVIMESMACGIPVVAVDSYGGGPRFIMDGGRYGCLVGANASNIKTAIKELLVNQEKRQKIIEEQNTRVETFNFDNISKRWLSYLQSL